MESISRRRIDDIVYERLLANIQNGEWKSGDKLPSENELCAAFNVSRASVRAAIQRLRALGFIVVRQGKGSYVSTFDEAHTYRNLNQDLNLSPKQFSDITAFREAIEPAAISLILRRGKDADLTQIERAYGMMKQAALDNDQDEFVLQDCAFHLSLLAATDNEMFIQLARIFKEQYFIFFRELNKFLFEEQNGDVRAVFYPNDPDDAHTVLLQQLRARSDIGSQEAINQIFTDNRKRFALYLRAKTTRGKTGEQ